MTCSCCTSFYPYSTAAAAADGHWVPVLRLGGRRSLRSMHRELGHSCAVACADRNNTVSSLVCRSAGTGELDTGWKEGCCCGGAAAADRSHKSPSEFMLERAEVNPATPLSPALGKKLGVFAKKRGRLVGAGAPPRIPVQTRNTRHMQNSNGSLRYRLRLGGVDNSTSGKAIGHSIRREGGEDIVRTRFSPNGSYLAMCTAGGALRVYETETGKLVSSIPHAHARGINDICWHSSSAYVFTASSDATAALFPLLFREKASFSRRVIASAAVGGKCSEILVPTQKGISPVLEFFVANLSGRGNSTAANGHVLEEATTLAAPVLSVAAPHSGGGCASVSSLYTSSYDEFIRMWDYRSPRFPLLQVRAHDGPVTSIDFLDASPLLLPPYISPPAAVSCCCCCECHIDCGSAASLSSPTSHKRSSFHVSSGCKFDAAFSAVAEANAAVAVPEMLSSASVDGLVRLWEAPNLRMLRTLRSGRGGWEGGSGGTSAGPLAGFDDALTASAASNSIAASACNAGDTFCVHDSGKDVSPSAVCCHVTWSRSGNFLLCLYEGGYDGGTLLRLHTSVLPKQQQRIACRKRLLQQHKKDLVPQHLYGDFVFCDKSNSNGSNHSCYDSCILREKSGSTRCSNSTASKPFSNEGNGKQYEKQETAEDSVSVDKQEAEHSEWEADEEESRWGQETCMPLAPPPQHLQRQHQYPVQRKPNQNLLACNKQRPHRRPDSFIAESVNALSGRLLQELAEEEEKCSNMRSQHSIQHNSETCTSLESKRKIFSPFGAFWRDYALIPGSNGCIWIFDAMRGQLLHTLTPAADKGRNCQGTYKTLAAAGAESLCTSVDAHPDWSIGVLASSCTAPDGAVVVWLWEATGEG